MSPPKLITMLEQLIALPSISCVSSQFDQSNQGVVERLAEWCGTLGFAVEVLPIADCPGKYNLVAALGKGEGGLVLSGHTDTVPYDEARWRHDPFRLTEDEQRFYGLGTSDMKSFFALALEAVRRIDRNKLKQPLVLVATADEESSMCGAQSLHKSARRLGRYAVIGEPTGLRPVNRHKGILMESLHVHGRTGHSSDPALGSNALEGMHKVIGALLRLRGELQQQYHNPAFHVPVPTMNLGHIHGGDNPNRICGDCELHLDLRPLPGMSLEQLRRQIHQYALDALANSELRLEMQPLFGGIDAMETPAESALVRAVEKLTGYSSEAVAFATEGPYFSSMGMECVILGPGHIEQAHQPDEYIDSAQLNPTVDLLERLIEHFCMRDCNG